MGNSKYSILIVGMYGIPSHILRFIRNLKITNPAVSITLFSDRNKEEFTSEIDDYIDDYIQQIKVTCWFRKIPFIRRYVYSSPFINQFKKLAKQRRFDIVNIHYPSYKMSYVMKYLKRMSKTIVVSPWGSDVLRVTDNKELSKLSIVFANCDYITVGTTGDFGRVLYLQMKIDERKFHPLAWGSETIDYINEHILEISRDRAKELLRLDDRYLITCGYNAFEEQRHEIILKAIHEKLQQLPSNTTLLLPVTYGSSYGTRKKDYVERLKALCNDLQLPVIFYENYLSVSEVFLLRRATDMFVHIQTTDGGNSSLQEYVLCGAKIIHGSWIHYINLESFKPLFYYPVTKLEELGDVIVDAYYSDPIKTPVQVIEAIRARGWRSKMKHWNEFFISCCN